MVNHEIKCPTCNKKFISDWSNKYKKYCSVKCVVTNPDIIKRQNESRKIDRKNNPKKYIRASKKISKALKGKPSPLRGKSKSEETKKRMRHSHKMVNSLKGKTYEEIHGIEKARELKKQRFQNGSRMSGKEVWKILRNNPEKLEQWKEKHRGENNGMKQPEAREKISQSKKEWWKSLTPEQWYNYWKNNKRGWIRPNKEELQLSDVLKKLNTNFKYVGNGEIIIGGKNPDFIDKKNKLIIEYFGTFWHKPEDEKERKNHFAKYGYNTLVIWDTELNSGEVINKIEEFI